MTKIKKKRGPYETCNMVFERGNRNVIVFLEPGCLVLKAKKLREEYRIPYSTIYLMAVKAAADSERKSAAKR